jgi:hypothetical protein
MIQLPSVTMICVDTVNYGDAQLAILKSLEQISPAEVIFFTDVEISSDKFETRLIPHLYSKDDYSKWMIKELGQQKFNTSHILVIQADGYVLDGGCWEDDFLQYDYIGAPWLYVDGRNVGNGGFSLRSVELHKVLAYDGFIQCYNNEDDVICRIYRGYLEESAFMNFAPDKVAHRFAYELHEPKQPTFGFHGKFHKPYVEPIVIKRTAALGDVVQVEPVLEYFHSKGHPVYLDTLPEFYTLFARHHFPVGDYSQFDKNVIKHRVINLDHAYEVNPKQLHLKSYFECAGISDYTLRNPKLNFYIDENNKLFQKYVVIHIDDRETTHRNAYGVKWNKVREYLERTGHTVIQIGKNSSSDAGIRFNTATMPMLMYLIAGAEFFIGVDSGPASIAIALGKKCVLLFGSVNPYFIHHDLRQSIALQSMCPIQKQNCWHESPGTTGIPCAVNVDTPPCCIHDTEKVINSIMRIQ